uniref:aldehyde oxygenase (deformylating) n=2 Tax=Aegilops tauschii subsp. strangulata TaxID=200361 RepID=A0A453NII9_AEGTS
NSSAMAPPLSSWPWASLGIYKYFLLGPLVWKVAQEWAEQGGAPLGSRWLHLLLLFSARGLTYQFWFSYSNMLFLTRRRRVVPDGVDFRQVDHEWDWDNFLVLQTLIGAALVNGPLPLPGLEDLRVWDPRGLGIALLLHVGLSEPVFYWAHRALHGAPLFGQYHAGHHSTPVTQPLTAGFGTPLEALLLTLTTGVPLAGAFLMGAGSLGLVYVHLLTFDYLRSMGYSNVEVISHRVFEALPPLRYLIYTPTYLSLHHREKDSNFCLFMPLFDLLGGTLNSKSWELQKEIYQGKNDRVPEFVFLVHVVDIMSSMHVPFVLRSISSVPFENHLILLPFWPVALVYGLLMWCCSKTFLVSFYYLRGRLHQTWSVPRHGFQYFIPAAKAGINRQIELAILRADRMGVKVLSLAALNKNEALNGGGTLFVDKHPDLRVRVVHGNTLTAAVILNEIPSNTKEVFLTGATSKLGRAIALYLCRKKIRVVVHADHVVGEVPEDPEGGARGVPAVPRAGHQVPGRAELQDVARGQVAVAEGAAVGAAGDALPPVRRAAHHRVPSRLHLRQARRHEAPQGRAGPRLLRVLYGARGGARVPRRRRGALPGGVGAPRGGRARRRPDRRRVEGGAQARPHAGV